MDDCIFSDDADILNSKIDNLGADMQWMKTALIEWAQAIQQNEQTNVLIEKYCKDDFKRVDVSTPKADFIYIILY